MDAEARRLAFVLPVEQRRCQWCGRGSEWSERWEFVNGRRWYHEECINLLDMVS
jgi:hypothetical protein